MHELAEARTAAGVLVLCLTARSPRHRSVLHDCREAARPPGRAQPRMGARRRCSTLAALALLLGAACELAGAGTPSKKCKKGVRASTRCFFAAGSDALGDYVQTFVDEGFETANDFIENELTVEDYEGLGIE
eukprot:COSAG03_NODE_6547_length_1042_cov_2.622481_2_plen_131_part_01